MLARAAFGAAVASVVAAPARAESPRSVAWLPARETTFVGRDWRAAIDTATRVPARLWGPGLSAPNTVRSAEVALAYARAFLATHIAALAPGSTLDDFVLAANDLDAGQRTVAFTQHHRGIPVRGGQLSLRFKNDRLFLISSQAVPVRGAAPRANLAPPPASDERGPPMYLPVTTDDSTELRLVQAVTVSTKDDRFEVLVDVVTGEPLVKRSLLRHASGTLVFNAPSGGGQRADYPAQSLGILLDGASGETDTAGGFSFATASAELVVGTSGRFVDVATMSGTPFTQTLTATDGALLTVDQRSDELMDAQISAYAHVTLVKNWARRVTDGSLPWLDEKLVVNVNHVNVCNAYYDGGSKTLNFFQAGFGGTTSCANTALVADVVHHEFGHALHDAAIIPGAGLFDYSLSEGIGDYVAATMSSDPRMGIGFFSDMPTVPMRHLDDVDRRLPEDVDLSVHANGLIFGGAMWDLRKALTAQLGADGALVADRLLYQGIRRATDMATTYLEVLAADDDDGDLVNGTPHGCAITAAFAAHGLVPEGAYGTAGVQEPVIDGAKIVVDVRPSACADTAVTALRIETRRRGITGSEETFTPTTASSTPDVNGFIRYEAELPEVFDGDVLQYRVTAELAGGGTVQHPQNAADPYFEAFIGEVTPVFCDNFDGAVYPRGFTHALTAGDQGYGADEWMWGPPRGGVYSGDPLEAYSGTKIFGTDLGGSQAEGWYAPSRSSRLSTPVIALGTRSSNTRVHLQYRRWVALGIGDRVEIAANEQPVWSSAQPGSGIAQHRDRAWRFHDVDVTDQVADDGSLRIDFSVIADNAGAAGGWNIDDLCVVVTAAPVCTTADCADEAGCGCRTGSAPGTVLLGVMLFFGSRFRVRRGRLRSARRHRPT